MLKIFISTVEFVWTEKGMKDLLWCLLIAHSIFHGTSFVLSYFLICPTT